MSRDTSKVPWPRERVPLARIWKYYTVAFTEAFYINLPSLLGIVAELSKFTLLLISLLSFRFSFDEACQSSRKVYYLMKLAKTIRGVVARIVFAIPALSFISPTYLEFQVVWSTAPSYTADPISAGIWMARIWCI